MCPCKDNRRANRTTFWKQSTMETKTMYEEAAQQWAKEQADIWEAQQWKEW